MELTKEEKELFQLHDKNLTESASYHVEDGILDIYTMQESYNRYEITCNYLKKMIMEVAKKRGYNIDANAVIDTDKLLEEIIEVDDALLGFNPLYYKDSSKLKKYFNEMTKNTSWQQIEKIEAAFGRTTDGFRNYFASYVSKLIGLADKLDYELNKHDEPIISVSDDVDDSEWVWEDGNEVDFGDDFALIDIDDWHNDEEIANNENKDDDLSETKLSKFIKFINTSNTLIRYRNLGYVVRNELFELMKKRKLEDFYSNEEFAQMFDIIMSHDKTKNAYYFHGTQCLEDAEYILDEGLGMMKDDLSSTAYREFTKDEVILYSRGFGGEIGRDAIVIIDVPLDNIGNNTNIIENSNENKQMHFNPSGLQGLNKGASYVINPQNIVGYVDKLNKRIVFNPKYKNYEKYTNIINDNNYSIRK